MRASEEELVSVEDVGPVVSTSIAEWFKRAYHKKILKKFEKAGLTVIPEKAPAKGKLSGKTFVLTGTLDKLGREEAGDKIRALGGKVSSSVSKDTDYVVVGSDPGSKYDKAQKLGVKTLTEEEFLEMVS
jgi:DNA ligase (NAD+)